MNSTEAPYEPYCGEGLFQFYSTYKGYHGYVSLVVCLFGSVANLLNIIVLTRREMSSPTNAILTGLAVADLLVMLDYIPFATHIHFPSASLADRYSYGWALFVLLHSHFTMVCHTISIWLTVTLAVWRYIAVAFPQRNREWCGMQRTVLVIAAGYIVSPIICIPAFLVFNIQQIHPANTSFEHQNITMYVVGLSRIASKDDRLAKINFWVYSVIIKIIPCIALTILSQRLISALIAAKKRRQNLTSSGPGHRQSSRNTYQERQTDRTTRMLLAVLLLFLLTEFPQGILGALSGILGPAFFKECYSRLGDVMDILALINSAINFMIYCVMSRQFRTTFNTLFRPRWLPVPQAENEAENGNHLNHTMTMVTQV